jgi:leucyl aminopeptidase
MNKTSTVRAVCPKNVREPSAGTVRLVPVWKGEAWGADGLSAADASALSAWLRKHDFKGEAGTAAWPTGVSVPVLLAGVGASGEFQSVRWFRGWAAAGKALVEAKAESSRVEDSVFDRLPEGAPGRATLSRLIAEGLGTGGYRFTALRGSADKEKQKPIPVELVGDDFAAPEVRRTVERGLLVADTVNEIRDATNLPANHFGPAEIAAFAQKLADANGLSCKVYDQKALRREKAGALLAVGQGSHRPPCLIRLAYTPSKAPKGVRPRVLVGKAILFDAGGICLKPAKNMEWMQYDKCGGMTAIAAVVLAARLKLPCPVVAYVPAAENLPGGGAQRPGDIVTARDGKTIEVLNTDAEGRLILADALTFAADEKPEAIVDIATLTGAVVIALGHEASGVMGNDGSLLEALDAAAGAAGERIWRFPAWEEYEKPLRGTFGDLRNMGAPGAAGTIAGGLFLKQFVPDGIPWAHLDIAGTAWNETATSCGAPGATLACARTLAAWLEGAGQES